MYTIFGCGSIGNAVALALHQNGEKVFVLDKDESTLKDLKELKIPVTVGDMQSIDLGIPEISDSSVIAILTGNKDVKLNMLKRLKRELRDKYILLVSEDTNDSKELYQNGADVVVQSNDIITNAVLLELKNAESRRSAFMLGNVIKKAAKKGLAVLLQNNPDPDAIASGLALKRICEKFDVDSKLFYGGTISHQQTKALVNMLNVDMIQIKTPEEARVVVSAFDKIALIEASVPSKNNILPDDLQPNIVIDHHMTDGEVKGEFVDIQPMVGATSTIMTGYMRQLDITPGAVLATALRYGIRVDTCGLTRNTTTDDLNAAAYLSPFIDTGLLNQIGNPQMSLETFDIIGRAIRNKEIKGSYMISFVEFINDRDALPQAAELMLQLEGIYTVLVFGIFKDKVQLSARSIDTRVNLGSILQKAFGNINAGGHQNMAAGTIDLGIFGEVTDKKALLKVTSDAVRKKFFSAVGVGLDEEVPEEGVS